MLLFAKISLASFIYNIIDDFILPNDFARDLYLKNKIIKCIPHLISTDTDSAALMFLFICELDCWITEDKARKNTFEIILKTRIKI